jgi:dihydrofolate reductase
MTRFFVQISVSADGFIEDANGGLDWFTGDKAVEDYATDTLRTIGGMVFGRTAHALLADFWKNAPADDPSPDLPEQARLMNGLPKYVLTHGALATDWENSHRVGLEDLPRITRDARRPIALFAGAAAVRAALGTGLVDELRLIRYPVLLGSGKPLFDGSGQRRRLVLAEERQFTSGAVVSRYALPDAPVRQDAGARD